MRDYTPLAATAEDGQLTLEFALHGHGAAASWAQQAEEGMQAIIAGPKGSMIIPAQQDWHLLVGDASSLPAIRRRLAELPPSAHVEVILLRADSHDSWALPQQANWRSASWPMARPCWPPAQLASTGRPWFCLVRGRGRADASGAHHIAGRKQLPREGVKVAAYWRLGEADFHERLA
jgi:NADPH-dependent ferric siderophore reductase